MLYRRRATRVRRPVVAAAVAAALLALGACESGADADAQTKAKGDTGPSVVAPGRPGEPAKTLSADEARKAVPDDSPNSADFRYAQRMITHHRQALQMTSLAPTRATSKQVKLLAERISAAQKPEIGAMEGWLKANGGAEQKENGGHDHGHEAMPGMATDAQLTQLRAAKGKAFDELFLKLMITHHQGAVTMATEVLSDGANILIEEMANDVIAQQTVEVNRMRSM